MLVAFDAARGPDGKISVGKWDRICVPTGQPDRKDDLETEFTVETMSQMVDNFAERGDLIPVDYNHQTNYAAQNGQPAPALAWYGVLAVVDGGRPVYSLAAKGVREAGDLSALSGAADGLWALRTEVTELGEQLLPNFKYLSPTFTPKGTRRDGSDCGYSLIAVAATNSPFQEGTQITFSKPSGADPEPQKERAPMKMSPEMLAKLGLAEDASPEECYAALAKHFESAEADKSEMSAKLAKYESDAEMAKLEADKKAEEMAKLEADKKDGDKDEKKDAAMATMSASLKAAVAKIEKLEAREGEREKAAEREREAKYEALADAACAGDYPKEARAALIKFARVDYDAARASVAHLLPKTGAPAHLFERASKNGAPASPGAPTSAREDAGPLKPRVTVSMGRRFVELDAPFADEVKKLAESKDPAIAAKVDKLIPDAKKRPQMFERLLAADKVVRAERPDLALAADGE